MVNHGVTMAVPFRKIKIEVAMYRGVGSGKLIGSGGGNVSAGIGGVSGRGTGNWWW